MLMFASAGFSCCSCVIQERRTSSLALPWLMQMATMFPSKIKEVDLFLIYDVLRNFKKTSKKL